MRIPSPIPCCKAALAFLLLPAALAAQSPQDLKNVLDRLDRLERENRAMAEEIRVLRGELAAARPTAEAATIEEKVDIHDSRLAEQAQTKVESSQHFPIKITGMAVFNAFMNSKQSGVVDFPTIAAAGRGPAAAGATLRHTTIGLEYHGPTALWGGQVRGAAFIDFFGGGNTTTNHLFRLRTATVNIDWKDRSVMVGQDKPVFSPRDPSSLAQVGVAPLTASGNLWLWQPQVRFEQRLHLGPQTTFRAQVSASQTPDYTAAVPAAFAASLERVRPAFQGRFELGHSLDDTRRIEIAPGFHTSTTHVAGTSAPSNLFTIDWFANPWKRLESSGFLFTGQNLAMFGIGAIRQGFTVLGPRSVLPVHSKGGWSQLSLIATPRLTFNVFGGMHDDRNSDLRAATAVARNQTGAINFFYRIAPNVLLVFETAQTRTTYLGIGNRLNNHYDLAIAYLF